MFLKEKKKNIKALASFSFPFDKLPKRPSTKPCDHHHPWFNSDRQLFGLSYSYSQGHSLKSHSDQIIPLIQTLQVAFFCPR